VARILVVDDATFMRVRACKVLQSGARDFIVKPFQPDRVLAAIEKLLAA
jgi:DNA-binding response OmpR family regulator